MRPVCRLRGTVRSGVLRMAAIFTGRAGVRSRRNFMLCRWHPVVELTGTLQDFAYDHFRLQNILDDVVEGRVHSRATLYGIIDGSYLHEAIMILSNTETTWKN